MNFTTSLLCVYLYSVTENICPTMFSSPFQISHNRFSFTLIWTDPVLEIDILDTNELDLRTRGILVEVGNPDIMTKELWGTKFRFYVLMFPWRDLRMHCRKLRISHNDLHLEASVTRLKTDSITTRPICSI